MSDSWERIRRSFWHPHKQEAALEIHKAGKEWRKCKDCCLPFATEEMVGDQCRGCLQFEARYEDYRRDLEKRLARVQVRDRRPVQVDGSTARIPDGAGCSERVPLWMLDSDYGRGQ